MLTIKLWMFTWWLWKAIIIHKEDNNNVGINQISSVKVDDIVDGYDLCFCMWLHLVQDAHDNKKFPCLFACDFKDSLMVAQPSEFAEKEQNRFRLDKVLVKY